jgi:hypothetical protein
LLHLLKKKGVEGYSMKSKKVELEAALLRTAKRRGKLNAPPGRRYSETDELLRLDQSCDNLEVPCDTIGAAISPLSSSSFRARPIHDRAAGLGDKDLL